MVSVDATCGDGASERDSEGDGSGFLTIVMIGCDTPPKSGSSAWFTPLAGVTCIWADTRMCRHSATKAENKIM